MNRRGQKELPDFLSVTELRSSCQPFHCYRKKTDVINRSKHPKNSGSGGLWDPLNLQRQAHRWGQYLMDTAGTEPRCQRYHFPTVKKNQDTSKDDQKSLFTVEFWRAHKKNSCIWPIAIKLLCLTLIGTPRYRIISSVALKVLCFVCWLCGHVLPAVRHCSRRQPQCMWA